MLNNVQESLHQLEIIKLIKDIEKKLAEYYGAQQPECLNPEIHNSFWCVWVNHYGWIRTSDLLQGKIQ